MFMSNSNEPIKVPYLQKVWHSINVEWHTCERPKILSVKARKTLVV